MLSNGSAGNWVYMFSVYKCMIYYISHDTNSVSLNVKMVTADFKNDKESAVKWSFTSSDQWRTPQGQTEEFGLGCGFYKNAPISFRMWLLAKISVWHCKNNVWFFCSKIMKTFLRNCRHFETGIDRYHGTRQFFCFEVCVCMRACVFVCSSSV